MGEGNFVMSSGCGRPYLARVLAASRRWQSLASGYRAVRGVREEAEYGVAVVCQLGYFGLEGGLDAHIGVGQFVSLSVSQFPRALPRG